MRFVRYTVSLTDGRVVGIVWQDTPFSREDCGRVTIDAQECITRDLGAVEIDHEILEDGSRRDVSMVLMRAHRLGVLEAHHPEVYAAIDEAGITDKELAQRYHQARAAKKASERVVEEALERTSFNPLPGDKAIAVHATPCTLPGLRERVRQHGPQVIGARVRAWLAAVLPAHVSAELAIARGIPISAIKASEALRIRRDPLAGSRMEILERVAQERSDLDARRRLIKRQSIGERRG